MTDRYELTMLDAALGDGTAARRCVFEVFGRRLPGGRRYGVFAGTGRLLDAIERFRFEEAELHWLAEQRIVSDRTLEWLAGYRFTGTISGSSVTLSLMPSWRIICASRVRTLSSWARPFSMTA